MTIVENRACKLQVSRGQEYEIRLHKLADFIEDARNSLGKK